jgi:hypothetical protein
MPTDISFPQNSGNSAPLCGSMNQGLPEVGGPNTRIALHPLKVSERQIQVHIQLAQIIESRDGFDGPVAQLAAGTFTISSGNSFPINKGITFCGTCRPRRYAIPGGRQRAAGSRSGLTPATRWVRASELTKPDPEAALSTPAAATLGHGRPVRSDEALRAAGQRALRRLDAVHATRSR